VLPGQDLTARIITELATSISSLVTGSPGDQAPDQPLRQAAITENNLIPSSYPQEQASY
jgi:hypothetical protein